MKNLKFITLVLLMIVSIGFIFAQPSEGGEQRQRPSTEERAKSETKTLVEKLTLDEKQSETVLEINLKSMQKTDSLMTKRSQETMAAVQKEEAAKVESIKTVLNEKQLKSYEEYLEELKKAREARQQQGGQRGGQR